MVKRLLACLIVIGTLLCMTATVAGAASDLKYWIGVDVVNQRTTVYSTKDNSVVHRFICSTGLKSGYTPLGTFKMPKPRASTDRKEWYYLSEYRCWVKYASRIKGAILFHSLPYNSKNDADIDPEALANLGKPASHGCIRLKDAAAQWIARHCPEGTVVVIHRGANDSRITKILGTSAGTKLTSEFSAAPEVQALSLNVDSSVTLNLGETFQLECTVQPSSAASKAVLKWSSSDKKTVSVSSDGLVTPLKAGTATITVRSYNATKATVKIKVVDPTRAMRIDLDQEGTVLLPVGTSLQLNAAMQPETAVSPLKWASSKGKCAAVDGNGLVTAHKEGTATITVRTNTKKTDTVKVKVYDPAKPETVELAESGTLTLKLGETLQLHAAATNAVDEMIEAEQAFAWSSSSKKIATVDADGVVTPVKAGTTTIAVRTANGKKDTVKVKVYDPQLVAGVALAESGTLYLSLGQTLQLNAVAVNAAGEEIVAADMFRWKSSSAKIATVDDGGVVTPVKTGTATITVKTATGKTDSVKVKVVDPDVAAQIVIDQGQRIRVALDDSVQLTASVYPDTAHTAIRWTSHAKRYAEVDRETGAVTLLRTGEAKISVRTENGKEDVIYLEIVKPQATPVPTETPAPDPTATPVPDETPEPEINDK